MPIQSLQLTNVGPFRPRPDGSGSDGIKLEFDPNVNLLIGPNNVGKSTILQVLALATRDTSSQIPNAFQNAIEDFRVDYNRPGADVSLAWTNPIGDYRRLWNVLAYLHSGDYNVADLEIGGRDGSVAVDDFEPFALLREFGYVGYYNPSSPKTVPSHATQPLRDTGFNENVWDEDADPYVYSAVYMKLSGDPSGRGVSAEIDQVISEITEEPQAEGFRVKIGVGIFADDSESGHDEWRKGQGKFTTTDGELTYSELSHGTRSVFAWVSRFVLGMADYYEADKYEGWKRQPGIFIIDEIDAHLHPSWQRHIIPTLQRHFPNVQIFASTHSPMMVAGLQKGQVHLLKRNETTGAVEWSRNEQDIIGWTADEIYRTFMGIDDPTDELTVQRANRLRELRDKESRTEAEEDEMNALRRQVNEDLLAGGRINAQRERFDAIMQDFLRSRMSDLSQDGV